MFFRYLVLIYIFINLIFTFCNSGKLFNTLNISAEKYKRKFWTKFMENVLSLTLQKFEFIS